MNFKLILFIQLIFFTGSLFAQSRLYIIPNIGINISKFSNKEDKESKHVSTSFSPQINTGVTAGFKVIKNFYLELGINYNRNKLLNTVNYNADLPDSNGVYRPMNIELNSTLNNILLPISINYIINRKKSSLQFGFGVYYSGLTSYKRERVINDILYPILNGRESVDKSESTYYFNDYTTGKPTVLHYSMFDWIYKKESSGILFNVSYFKSLSKKISLGLKLNSNFGLVDFENKQKIIAKCIEYPNLNIPKLDFFDEYEYLAKYKQNAGIHRTATYLNDYSLSAVFKFNF